MDCDIDSIMDHSASSPPLIFSSTLFSWDRGAFQGGFNALNVCGLTTASTRMVDTLMISFQILTSFSSLVCVVHSDHNQPDTFPLSLLFLFVLDKSGLSCIGGFLSCMKDLNPEDYNLMYSLCSEPEPLPNFLADRES